MPTEIIQLPSGQNGNQNGGLNVLPVSNSGGGLFGNDQTNQLNNTINANGQRQVDAIADLKTTMIKEFCDARERDMQAIINKQADEISQLRTKDNISAQTNQILGYVNQVLAPIQAGLKEIQDKMPNTVPVQNPNLQVVNATPYVNGGYYGQTPFYGGF